MEQASSQVRRRDTAWEFLVIVVRRQGYLPLENPQRINNIAQNQETASYMSENDKGLPFHKKKQDAIVGWCITQPKFFMQCKNLVDPSWFSDPYAQKVYKAQLKWVKDNDVVPTVEEMRFSSEITLEEPALRTKLQAKVSECISETQHFHLEPLSKELEKWLRARIFYVGANAAQKDYNSERYEEAYRVMDACLKNIKEASFLNEREVSFADPIKDIEQSKNEIRNGLTFGLKTVDDLLLPGNENGALLPGDTTIMLAPTNIGKTTNMITIGNANLARGKRILLVTHEGRPMDIKEKVWRNHLGVDSKEYFELPNTEEGVKRLQRGSMMLNRFLTYVPYNKAGLTVEEVEPFIRRKQEELIAKQGKGYDLLIVDYPAKLSTKQAQQGSMSKRTIDEIVYGYFIQLALEYNFHSLLAIQTNREGAKVNKGQRDERRLLVMEDVHESYGVMQEATNVITMNKDAVAKARKRMTYHIDKSRSSETGFAVVARTDFARATTHSNELGSIWYRGTSTLADQVDDLLANPENNGQEIDTTQFV
jgi:DnaB-like helicase C terminal domain